VLASPDGAEKPASVRVKGDRGPPAVVPVFLGSKIDEHHNLIRILSDSTKETMPLREAFEHYHSEVGE